MAKCIKAKKSHLYMLNKLMAKVPKQSLEESSLKIMNFFRAVKKPLRKQLDESAELNKVVDEKLADVRKEYAETDKEVKRLESLKTSSPIDIAKLDSLYALAKDLIERGDKLVEKENKQLKAIQDDLNDKESEAVFDNEDFAFVEAIFKKNPSLFQVGDKEIHDLDTMDIVFSMFENAYAPKNNE